jgi:hypothetical protein
MLHPVGPKNHVLDVAFPLSHALNHLALHHEHHCQEYLFFA